MDWKTVLTSDLIAEVARIATGRNPEELAVSKAAKELDRRLPVSNWSCPGDLQIDSEGIDTPERQQELAKSLGARPLLPFSYECPECARIGSFDTPRKTLVCTRCKVPMQRVGHLVIETVSKEGEITARHTETNKVVTLSKPFDASVNVIQEGIKKKIEAFREQILELDEAELRADDLEDRRILLSSREDLESKITALEKVLAGTRAVIDPLRVAQLLPLPEWNPQALELKKLKAENEALRETAESQAKALAYAMAERDDLRGKNDALEQENMILNEHNKELCISHTRLYGPLENHTNEQLANILHSLPLLARSEFDRTRQRATQTEIERRERKKGDV